MQHALFNFLRSALIPKLRANVAAGTSCHVHLVLITIAAAGAGPYQLTVILLDLDLAVPAANLAVIALGIR